MSLPLTKENLAACYDYLCTTQPFSEWNMPDSEDVKFRVVKSGDVRGWYLLEHDGSHTIAISSRCIGRTQSLVETMAHEMIHLHQGDVKMDSPGAQHNRAFWKLADIVCEAHGFDPKLF
jgi:hypothetical protein